MKLQYFGRGAAYSISNAVTHHCYDDRDGIAETALATARKTSELVGNLIELLHKKNLLDDAEVVGLINCFDIANDT